MTDRNDMVQILDKFRQESNAHVERLINERMEIEKQHNRVVEEIAFHGESADNASRAIEAILGNDRAEARGQTVKESIMPMNPDLGKMNLFAESEKYR